MLIYETTSSFRRVKRIIGIATYKNSMMNVCAAAGVLGVVTLTSFADVLRGGIIRSGLLIEEDIVGRGG